MKQNDVVVLKSTKAKAVVVSINETNVQVEFWNTHLDRPMVKQVGRAFFDEAYMTLEAYMEERRAAEVADAAERVRSLEIGTILIRMYERVEDALWTWAKTESEAVFETRFWKTVDDVGPIGLVGQMRGAGVLDKELEALALTVIANREKRRSDAKFQEERCCAAYVMESTDQLAASGSWHKPHRVAEDDASAPMGMKGGVDQLTPTTKKIWGIKEGR